MNAAAGSSAQSQDIFCAQRLERVFRDCFLLSHNTLLCGGADEPLYQPARCPGDRHHLFYRSDYFASALHETAHWCIAGNARLALVDFGYWYAPEGRNPQQQRAFEAVECKPQALEWYFSRACGYCFRVSADNLEPSKGELPDTEPFCRDIVEQAGRWQRKGLPQRARTFYLALCAEFGTAGAPEDLAFELGEIL